MRTVRTPLEQHFVEKILAFFRSEIDPECKELENVSDKPDLAIASGSRVFGIEFSQLPSSYIMHGFRKKLPKPDFTTGSVEVHSGIYPFEPHRWVHEALKKKEKRASEYKQAVNADEVWLVLHSPEQDRDWPMSAAEYENSRQLEHQLMRLALAGYQSKFERVFFIYSDGEVKELTEGLPEGSQIIPPLGVGYPTFAMHRFSFSFRVPESRVFAKEYTFTDLDVKRTIIEPLDEAMKQQEPDLWKLRFSVRVRLEVEMLEGVIVCGSTELVKRWPIKALPGQIVTSHVNLFTGIRNEAWKIGVPDND